MRFGLALALMNDGFFTYDFGDTGDGSPVDWWYDEYISTSVFRSPRQRRSRRAQLQT